MKHLLAASLVLSSLAACSADSDSREADVLISKICARQSECCPKRSTTECKQNMAIALDPLFEAEEISVDTAKLDACLAKVDGATCDQVAGHGGVLPVLGFCEQFWQGTQEIGESCGGENLLSAIYADDQCKSGECADKKCVAKAGLGETCGTVDCQDGLACDTSTHQCVTPHANGEACSSDSVCAEGSGCVRSGDSRTCQLLTIIQIGEECGPGKQCVLGESACRCPVGSEGCLYGVCGDRSRCD